MKGLGLGRIIRIFRRFCLGGALLLSGCAAFDAGGAMATIDTDSTMYALEAQSIRVASTAEQIAAVETIVAAGTRIAQASAANAALGATLRAHQTGTPEVRAVVVSADDMGSSLEGDMMDEGFGPARPDAAMSVSSLSTAESTDPESGCSKGTVKEFRPGAASIFVTARVAALRSGTLFEVDWKRDERTLSSTTWLADYSKAFECVWFYATPSDFPFLPGSYAATLYVNGEAVGMTEFVITDDE